ncbi:hypothetical protein K488DRAFT_92640 [Vararia minispora EC-137]|uniref:Uncharacterized protein n=1 Tax=Vararia minispora EC-137 TaxID=1314806 RepID=A0ACB8Q3X1_9AGAM|nr:hypothetical protein K488DRAFT_92640 [Vararia minispora EC-137]
MPTDSLLSTQVAAQIDANGPVVLHWAQGEGRVRIQAEGDINSLEVDAEGHSPAQVAVSIKRKASPSAGVIPSDASLQLPSVQPNKRARHDHEVVGDTGKDGTSVRTDEARASGRERSEADRSSETEDDADPPDPAWKQKLLRRQIAGRSDQERYNELPLEAFTNTPGPSSVSSKRLNFPILLRAFRSVSAEARKSACKEERESNAGLF